MISFFFFLTLGVGGERNIYVLLMLESSGFGWVMGCGFPSGLFGKSENGIFAERYLGIYQALRALVWNLLEADVVTSDRRRRGLVLAIS